MNKYKKLSKLEQYEEFSIPSIRKRGVVLNQGIGSTTVMYYDERIEDKMGKFVSYKNINTTISPETKVVSNGKFNNKLRKKSKIKKRQGKNSISSRKDERFLQMANKFRESRK